MELDAKLHIYLQYYEREINLARIVEKAYYESNARMAEQVDALDVYVKPEDGKAYYVANGKFQSYVNLWDSDTDICDYETLSDTINLHHKVARRLVFEYRGKQCDCNSIIDRAVEKFMTIYSSKEPEEIEVYVRQEHEAAYYVMNGKYTGSVSMFA